MRKVKITGTAGVNKMAVFGMHSRDGEIRAQVVDSTSSAVLYPILKDNVAEGSTLYSDEWSAYKNLENEFVRGIVRHSVKEFVNGDCHTNGIESFWAAFSWNCGRI